MYHAGINAHITRTNLAHANERRTCEVFQKFYFHLLDYYRNLIGKPSNTFDRHTKLIDTTTISGVKIHTHFDSESEC